MRPSGARKLRGNVAAKPFVLADVSRRNTPSCCRTSGKSAPPLPPWMYTSPFTSTVDDEYQRARFKLAERASVLPMGLNRLLLLLPVFVVPVPVQLSPPAMKISPLCGRITCELQKMSVSVMLSSVRCPPVNPPDGSQMS